VDDDDRFRLDYEQTSQLYRALVDVRFKLLAIVPTISGAAVAVLNRPRPAAELLGVGLIGLVATVGVLLYDLRNSEISFALLDRQAELERALGLQVSVAGAKPAGLVEGRPRPAVRLLGLPPATHGLGLGLVYGAALAGWSYLVAWGALHAIDVEAARKAGAVIGAGVGVLTVVERLRTGP
jgi:hypothetical protein